MTSTIFTPTHPVSDALLHRAQRVVPNGMYGHQIATGLWPGAPQFVSRTAGSRIWDADGHEYIDLLCSWGPIIHGYQHPKIEQAVDRQRRLCDTANGPSEHFVALAEKLVDVVEHADWAMFAKNGSDVTTLCLTIARAHTGRSTILVEEGHLSRRSAVVQSRQDRCAAVGSRRPRLLHLQRPGRCREARRRARR